MWHSPILLSLGSPHLLTCECECVDSPLHRRTNFSTFLPYLSINLLILSLEFRISMFINLYIARPIYHFILIYTCGLTVVIKRICYVMLCSARTGFRAVTTPPALSLSISLSVCLSVSVCVCVCVGVASVRCVVIVKCESRYASLVEILDVKTRLFSDMAGQLTHSSGCLFCCRAELTRCLGPTSTQASVRRGCGYASQSVSGSPLHVRESHFTASSVVCDRYDTAYSKEFFGVHNFKSSCMM